jgi:hypothetical protein
MSRFFPALVFLIAFAGALRSAAPGAERFTGGKIEWTRLNTGSAYWNRHSDYDGELVGFIRANTSLNIDREWKATRPDDLTALCNFPFVYTDNIAPLSAAEARNLAEYLRRGGFLLIDACCASSVTPSPENFFDDQVKVLRKLFPNVRIGVLKPDHEIFSIYFKLKEFPPQVRPPLSDNGTWANRLSFPLRAVFVGDRMIGVISLSGWQCAWSVHGYNIPVANACMQMVTNIYVYAMTR